MADAAVEFLLENISQLLVIQAGLLSDSKEEISWIQTEFRVMVAFLQSFDPLHQLRQFVGADGLIDWTRNVTSKTEDLIKTYVRRQRQLLRSSVYLKSISSIKLRNLRVQLRGIRHDIIRVREEWRSFHLFINSPNLPGSPSRLFKFPAMNNLEFALRGRYLDLDVRDCMKWVADELFPLDDFLREIDNVQVLGERQKIWIQELRGMFQFIGESFEYTEHARVFRDVLPKMQNKILQLYRRYYAYGLGEIRVNNGSRSIFPRINMTTPIPALSRSEFLIRNAWGSMCSPFVGLSQMTMSYLSLLTPEASIEVLRVDLKLMNALIEDARSMGDLDERAKVWLNQLQEIAVDLEALDEHASNDQLLSRDKIDHIARDIRDLIARKITYGIGSALREAPIPDSIAATFVDAQPQLGLLSAARKFKKILEEATISKAELRRRAESVRKELQLMQASLEDVNRMENLDAGLKVWVEEMLGVAHEANAAVELDKKSYYTRMQVRRIKQVCHGLLVKSKGNHSCDIGDAKLTHSLFIYALAGTFPYRRFRGRGSGRGRGRVLQREIMLMRSLYNEIEDKDKLDGTAKAWVEELGNLARDASELINSELPSQNSICLMKQRSPPFEGIEDRIEQLSELREAYGIDLTKILFPDVREIKEKLLADQEQPCIIPILGMRRRQKEALQELINNDDAITQHFDWHAWVHVPEEFSGVSILEHTARQIVEQQRAKFLDVGSTLKLEAPTEETLMQMLLEILMYNRCLIVLDEIQSIEVWQRLERVFQKISTGSRIILISNEHTWSLLNSSSKAIFDPVRLGELPSETREVMPGSHAFDRYGVPSYFWQYLYYFLLFPANFEVPTRRLIVLWVAEGLVRRNEHESDEDVADRHLNKLIELGMVLGKTKKLNGKYKACQLNEDIRDTLSMTAEESRFFGDSHLKLSRLVDQHRTGDIVDRDGTSDSFSIHIHGNPNASTSVKSYGKVVSFMSFDTWEGNKPGEDIGNFLQKCISAGCFLELKVLDLEKVFRPKLPEAICSLILLKYLGLRWTYLEHLPKYMNKLLNLQVLDVKHTYISVLPSSIWSMQYLRHLYLSETYRTKFIGRPSDVSLDELQTLWGAFIDENSYVRNGLDTSRKIRKLGLSCRSSSSEPSLMSDQLKAVNNWISNLKYLEVLRLKSRDENGKAAELHLKPLRNKKLSTVYLLGKLEQSVVSAFPANLIDITLSGSELKDDPMTSLGDLKKLRILRLLSESVFCRSMHCSREGFPELQVLKIWKLENLEEWEVEEGALGSLKDLEIRSCTNLKMLPGTLQHVKTLEECLLTNMPKQFTDETKDRQHELGCLWAKIKFDPDVDQAQL